MYVVRGQSILGYNIGVDRLVGETTLVGTPVILESCLIMNRVLGVQEVASRETLLVATVATVRLTSYKSIKGRIFGDERRHGALGNSRITPAKISGLELARESGKRARVLPNRRRLGGISYSLLIGVWACIDRRG